MAYITVTNLASKLRISAIDLNTILADLGFQRKYEKVWISTEAGREYSREARTVNRKGEPVSFLSWEESILPLLAGYGSPTRKEMDALRARLAELEARLRMAEAKLA